MASNLRDGVVLSLDIGSVRIGVASCRLDVRIPQPVLTLDYDEQTIAQDICRLVQEQGAVMLVAGWPRGMDGQSTQQTAFVEDVVAKIRPALDIPVHLQDEALTSNRAEAELQARKKPYAKADVDALAATYILEDFLQSSAFAEALAGMAEADNV